MGFFNEWPKPKIITVTGVILSLGGMALIFSPFPGFGFVTHVLGDLTIVFGIIYYVFPEEKKSKD